MSDELKLVVLDATPDLVTREAVYHLAPTKPVVNQELVAMLRAMLEQAEAGELLSMVACGERSGREVYTATTACDDGFRMLGAIETLKARLIRGLELG